MVNVKEHFVAIPVKLNNIILVLLPLKSLLSIQKVTYLNTELKTTKPLMYVAKTRIPDKKLEQKLIN